ncbi:ribulose-phosphate 3-epimerase [Falsarthrobacter nasiphocae]|uniref:Ribulose-phosphate 3-epimerase n=1 Tax=Falsarthrobacter nasiphocae TaxID=189863 RepID=A0AAE3YG01_9MICC|nr:ribulose-phosphate 3-epimerase [Falsarthrobacter nasiphocae]MDR6891238.1 ribulose-phosphate 3-epimerase [Falsarthrobacter nasiphocae]
MSHVTIHPSILSADFAALGQALESIGTADAVHVDVMDQHFVPNLTLGLPVVSRLAEVSSLPLDVHLMIEDPDRWAPQYAEAGAASVTFHAEAAGAPIRLAREIRAAGAKAAMALKPTTPLDVALPVLDELDMLLIMSVEPGFGGQPFLESSLPKIRAAVEAIGSRGIVVQVDGGVSPETVERIAEAGASCFVAGSAVFGAKDPSAAVEKIRGLAARAAGCADRA